MVLEGLALAKHFSLSWRLEARHGTDGVLFVGPRAAERDLHHTVGIDGLREAFIHEALLVLGF